MIEKRYIITCDWCGREEFASENKKESLNFYARNFYLYRLSSINAMADYLHGQAYEHLTFCCEECAEKYFKTNPKDKPFYKIVKTRK